jgi:hypothetical protein
MERPLLTIVLLSLLGIMMMAGLASAATTTPQTSPDDTKVNLQEIDYKTVVIQENAKTQAYIKQELAKRDADMEKKIYKYVDDNFSVLDERIDGFIRKATFKLGMVFFSGMVLGGTILLLINKALRKKKIGRKHLTPEESKGETTYTTLPDETLEQMRRLRKGEEPKEIIKERLKDLYKEALDDLQVKKAGINDYLLLKEKGDYL